MVEQADEVDAALKIKVKADAAFTNHSNDMDSQLKQISDVKQKLLTFMLTTDAFLKTEANDCKERCNAFEVVGIMIGTVKGC